MSDAQRKRPLTGAGTARSVANSASVGGILYAPTVEAPGTGGLTISSGAGGAIQIGAAGETVALVGSTSINGTAGASCTGTPTSSFATINGIVTHC